MGCPGRAHDLGHGSSLGQGQFQTESELREPVFSTPGSQGNESLDSEGGSGWLTTLSTMLPKTKWREANLLSTAHKAHLS